MLAGTSMAKKTVLVVDDHPLFRAGVVAVVNQDPDWRVVAEASTAPEARAAAAEHRPHAAIVDLMLQSDDGLKLLRELRDEVPAMRIIVLSMLDEAVYRPKALQAGASVFVPKIAGPAAIVAALRADAPSHPPPVAPPPHDLDSLSERELHVFTQLGFGRSTQEIAVAFGVSVKTIETHRENIKAKLGLPHANALVARAARWVNEQGITR